MKKQFWLTICFFALWLSLPAQKITEIRISGEYSGVSLQKFFSEIEATHPVRFFFRPEWVKNQNVNQKFENEALADALTRIFQKTDINFTFFNNNMVVLLPRKATSSDFSAWLYESGQRKFVLRGKVTNAHTGKPLYGASILIQENGKGTITDTAGNFQLRLAPGSYHFSVHYTGLLPENKQLVLRKNTFLEITMIDKAVELGEVRVYGEARDANVRSTRMGTNVLISRRMKEIPAFMGEADIVKSLILLPGVSTVGEGSSGFNVRGGGADQNLILFDHCPVFNPSHVFGFFSAFNADAVQDVSLHKGTMPAKYGGRLSAVLDVRQRSGNNQKIKGQGGVGILTTRLTIDGPLKKDKTNFLLAARAAYSDYLLRLMPDQDLRESAAGFFDANAKLMHKFNDKNRLSFSAYASKDRFKLASDTAYAWQTLSASLRWNHIFSERLNSYFTAAFSKNQHTVGSQHPINGFELDNGLEYRSLKADFSFFPNGKTSLNFGASTIWQGIKPGKLMPNSPEGSIVAKQGEQENSANAAAYAEAEIRLSEKISLRAGLRYSHFFRLGGTHFLYQKGLPRNAEHICDTLFFPKGEVAQQYGGIEPRVAMNIALSPKSALKMAYNRSRQYIHLISNTAAITPIDIWRSSDRHIKPQVADQFSLGFFRNFKDNMIEASLEIYYKNIQNILEYKNGAELVLNQHLESELLQGKGRAYGAELLLRKNTGRLRGWAGYTFSRSEHRVESPFFGESINNGEYFPANFDKPHDFTLVASYEFSKRFIASANFSYSTGRPITIPDAKYIVDGILLLSYNERNNFRIPDYHRLDLSFTLKGSLKRNKKISSSYTLSLYNVYARKNVYSMFFKPVNYYPQANRLSVIGTIIPAFTWNFKF